MQKPGCPADALAALEPDYASQIDYPESPLKPLVLKQMTELGADLETGRKLKVLFNKIYNQIHIDSTISFTLHYI